MSAPHDVPVLADSAPPLPDDGLRGLWPGGVQVAGLGRTGLALALLLASEGVDPLGLWDPAPVGPADLGTGYLPADLGRPRAVAAERRLREGHPRLRVFAHHGPEPALLGSATVAVSPAGPDERLAVRALAAGHPLLPVTAGAVTTIGPWTVTGEPGCALCAAATGPGRVAPPTGREGRTREAESVVGALRTAVAVHDALLQGRGSLVWQGVLQLWAHGLDETCRRVRPAPGCPCDPDGLSAGLAALAAGIGPDLPRAAGAPGGDGGFPGG